MTAMTPNDPAAGARPQPMHPQPMQPQPIPPQPVPVVHQPMFVPVMHAAAPPRGMSITSMILGICSVFFGWTFLVPLIGLILGLVGLRREPAGRGFAWTGVILNGLMMLGWLLVLLAVGGSVLALFGLVGSASLAGV